MTRLGIDIPDSAKQIMLQESRFKNYNAHLQLCIRDFKHVCSQIPISLRRLFQV